MIVADSITIQAGIKMDIAFQLPDFFPQGVNLLVDGFQLGGIGDGSLLFLQFLEGLLGFGKTFVWWILFGRCKAFLHCTLLILFLHHNVVILFRKT